MERTVDLYKSVTIQHYEHFLKGPKHELLVAGIFTQIRLVWVGDLGTRPKN